jgi:hypothetical protein
MANKQPPEEAPNAKRVFTRREAMKRIATMSATVILAPLVAGMRPASAGEVEEISRYQSLADTGDVAKPVSYSDYTSYASSHSYTSAVYQSQNQNQGGGGYSNYSNVSYYSNTHYYSTAPFKYPTYTPYSNIYSRAYSNIYNRYAANYSNSYNRYGFHANMS